MKRLLSATLALALGFVGRPAHGTLVMAVPYAGGLVVGSDLRASRPDGTHEDGHHKIHIAGSVLFSVANIDQTDEGPHPFWVYEEVAKQVRGVPTVGEGDLPRLARALARAIDSARPDFAREHTGQDVSRVVFYHPHWAGSFLIHVTAEGAWAFDTNTQSRLTPNDSLVATFTGQGDFFWDTVWSSGRLPPTAVMLLGHPPLIHDVTLTEARQLVVDAIAASTVASAQAHRWSIGGGVELYLVDDAGPRRLTE